MSLKRQIGSGFLLIEALWFTIQLMTFLYEIVLTPHPQPSGCVLGSTNVLWSMPKTSLYKSVIYISSQILLSLAICYCLTLFLCIHNERNFSVPMPLLLTNFLILLSIKFSSFIHIAAKLSSVPLHFIIYKIHYIFTYICIIIKYIICTNLYIRRYYYII